MPKRSRGAVVNAGIEMRKEVAMMKFLVMFSMLFLLACNDVKPDEKYPNTIAFGSPEEIVKVLKREMASREGLDEIYALISSNERGGDDGQRVIRVKDGKAELSYYHKCNDIWRNPWAKSLSDREFDELRKSVLSVDRSEQRAEYLIGGTQWVCVHACRHLSVVVHMDNPDESTPTKWAVVKAFRSLAPSEQMENTK